ncbi:MAG TPA: response regulator transcription factor [Bellilinea sp.]|nr:response regulator transcription factor [Bellilinea sp.]
MARVLVVDDDAVLNQMVQANMKLAGHEVFSALSGEAALRDLATINPELVILDVMMPGMTGFEVCRRMRETTAVPVLFLTARGEEEDLVQGFDSGGDDYMRKPFSMRELEVRVRALLARAQRANEAHEAQMYVDDQLQIDLEEGTVKRANKVVHLTPTEFRVLRCLVRNRGKVLTHAELLEEAWGENYTDAIASLSLYVRYLREKIEKDPSKPEYIHTKWGIGYWFSPPQSIDVG